MGGQHLRTMLEEACWEGVSSQDGEVCSPPPPKASGWGAGLVLGASSMVESPRMNSSGIPR